MPRATLSVGLTLVLACVSAGFFLLLRCEGKGRVFGPGSRWWAVSVIALTGVLSTALAFITANAARDLTVAIVGLGVIAPSALWLGEIRQGAPERRNIYRDASTLWLSWMLSRLEEGMAEDRMEWCEAHLDPEWTGDDLLRAARHYHDYLEHRLSAEERRRIRLRSLHHNIEARLDIARLIGAGTGRTKIIAALAGSRLPQEARYRRNIDDLPRLAAMLRHDARNDVARLLSAAYNAGFHRLVRYEHSTGPTWGGQPVGSQRSHP